MKLRQLHLDFFRSSLSDDQPEVNAWERKGGRVQEMLDQKPWEDMMLKEGRREEKGGEIEDEGGMEMENNERKKMGAAPMEERQKRSPACLIRCLRSRLLHPAQCHALC